MQTQISSLHIYPLKAAKGIKLDKMTITHTGPKYDREWMLIDKNLNFISQRTSPQMGQLNTQLTETELVITAEGLSPLKIDLNDYGSQDEVVKIFGKETKAHVLDKQYADWFSNFLNKEVQLVRSPKADTRHTSGNHGPMTPILFPDGYPFLLTNEATLEELNQKLSRPITMNRFRPNLVVTGVSTNTEDTWKQFEINSVQFNAVKACTRCVVIQLDPATGQKNPEVNKVLSSYRMKDGKIVFGQNLIHFNQGEIKVGDTIKF